MPNFCACGSLQVWQLVNQPFYTIFEVHRTIRRCLFSDLGQNLCHFFPILIIILQFVKEYNNFTRQIAPIQYSGRSIQRIHHQRGLFSQVNPPLCSTPQGNNGLWEKTFEKKYILIQFTKSPVRPANFKFYQAPKLTMRTVEYLNERW